jgi:hypothetical protein
MFKVTFILIASFLYTNVTFGRDLSKQEIVSFLSSNKISDPWKVEQVKYEERPSNIERDYEVYDSSLVVYSKPYELTSRVCASDYFQFDLNTKKTPVQIVDTTREVSIALVPCASANKENFTINLESREGALFAAKILKEVIPAYGGKSKNLRFEEPGLKTLFNSINQNDLVALDFVNDAGLEVFYPYKRQSASWCLSVKITFKDQHAVEMYVHKRYQEGETIKSPVRESIDVTDSR